MYDAGDKDGYSRIRPYKRGPRIRTHRWVYEQTYGPIPEDMVIMHTCDEPSCCNPKHLRLGTPANNNEDMRQKNRSMRGTRNVHHKLVEEEVYDIRRRYDAGSESLSALGRAYGVSHTAIRYIGRRKTWYWLPEKSCTSRED